MSNPVATFTQHNHITEAFRAGAVVTDMYANAPGIGYQRGVAARLVAA